MLIHDKHYYTNAMSYDNVVLGNKMIQEWYKNVDMSLYLSQGVGARYLCSQTHFQDNPERVSGSTQNEKNFRMQP